MTQLRFCIALILSMLLVLKVWAEDADKDAKKTPDEEPILKLETVIVEGSRLSNDAFNVIDTEGSTATKSALPLLETPVTVNVIDKELMELRGADSINKIVGYTAGITPETRGGNATRYDQLTIRGHDPKFSGFWNGMKLLYNGGFLGLQIDPFFLERVEILKGPASVLYGANPPGGLINQVSRTALEYDETRIGLKAGSQSMGAVELDNNSVVWDEDDSGFSYRILGKYFRRDGQAEQTERERYGIFPTATLRIGNHTRLIVRALYQRDPKAGSYGMQPREGTLVVHPSGKYVSKNFYDGDVNFEKFDREQKAIGYEFTHAFSDNWAFTNKLNAMQNSLTLESVGNSFSSLRKVKPNDKYRSALTRFILKSDEKLDFITMDNQLSGKIKLGDFTHNLLFGVDFQDSGSHRYTGQGVAPIIYIFDTDNNQLTDRKAALRMLNNIRSIKTITRQVGVYAQDQIKWGGLTLMYSGRYDIATSQQIRRRADTDTLIGQGDYEDKAQTNRVGALYLFDIGIAPFISWSQSFEPVAEVSESGVKFDPTTGEQIEFGLKYENRLGDTSATLSLFELEQKNPLRPDPNSPAFNIAIDGLTTRGVELDSKFKITDWLSTRFGFSHLEMQQKFPEQPELNGKMPVAVAKHTFSNWWQVNPIQDWIVALGLRQVGQSYGNDKNQFKVPSYRLLDFATSYEHRISRYPVKWSLSVSNLTDEYYVSSCYNYNTCWIGSERTIDAGVYVTF